MTITEASHLIAAAKPGDLPTTAQIRRMTDDELSAYLDRVGWNDELAIEEFNDRNAEAQFEDDSVDGPLYEVIDKRGETYRWCSSRGHAERLAECCNEDVTLEDVAPFDVRES